MVHNLTIMTSAQIQKLSPAALWIYNASVVGLLKRNGYDFNKKDGIKKWTLLHFCANRGNAAFVKNLLAAGANKNIKDAKGFTALDLAQRNAILVLDPKRRARYRKVIGLLSGVKPKTKVNDKIDEAIIAFGKKLITLDEMKYIMDRHIMTGKI